MNRRRLIAKIEIFLLNGLWRIPEVQQAVEQLEKIADELGLFADDLLDFRVNYDEFTKTLGVEFDGPHYKDIDDDQLLDKIQDLQNVIRWVIIDRLEEMLAGNDYEIVNHIFK